MQIKKASLVQLVVLAVCMFLLGVSGASAAGRPNRPQEASKKTASQAHVGHSRWHKPSGGGEAAFLKSLDGTNDSACSSSCCWAVCPQEGGGSIVAMASALPGALTEAMRKPPAVLPSSTLPVLSVC